MTGDGPVDFLSLEDLLDIAQGVVPGFVVRDLGLLASAAARPRMSAFGEDAYPTFCDKAAALMHAVARNHALIDGNKRLAWSACRVMCLMNGYDLRYGVDEAEAMVIGVAAGRIDVPVLSVDLERHLITVVAK
jgi:death-on-curing protein